MITPSDEQRKTGFRLDVRAGNGRRMEANGLAKQRKETAACGASCCHCPCRFCRNKEDSKVARTTSFSQPSSPREKGATKKKEEKVMPRRQDKQTHAEDILFHS